MQNNDVEKPCVYILQSLKNLRYYIGSTDNLKRRIEEHKRGKTKSTRNILPIKLVFRKEYDSLQEARKLEYRLKKLKRKDIINRIIKEGDIKMRV